MSKNQKPPNSGRPSKCQIKIRCFCNDCITISGELSYGPYQTFEWKLNLLKRSNLVMDVNKYCSNSVFVFFLALQFKLIAVEYIMLLRITRNGVDFLPVLAEIPSSLST